MKIVHIIPTLNLGGAENFTVQLANEQSKTQMVYLIVLRASIQKYNYINEVDDRVQVHFLEFKKKYHISQWIKLRKLISQIQPRVLHLHLHNALYYGCLCVPYFSKIKFIHTVHNSFKVWQRTFFVLNKIIFLRKRIIHVCVAPSIYQDFKRAFPKLKFNWVYNGILPYNVLRSDKEIEEVWKSVSTKENLHRAVVIANDSLYKGANLLVDICHKLKEIDFSYVCVIIGNIDSVLIDQLNLPDTIKIIGTKKNAIDFLTKADSLWITSFEEGLPIVALESLSIGKPVISTPAGGIKDVILNGKNGFLAEDYTAESFIKAVLKYDRLASEQKKFIFNQSLSYFSDNLHIKKINQSYLTLYSK